MAWERFGGGVGGMSDERGMDSDRTRHGKGQKV